MTETTTSSPAPAHATTDLLDELSWRGLVYQTTEGLAEALAAGPVSAYIGFDATGPSLHVGHLLPVMALVRLQRAGHRPVALVGGGTGMIGDPSGKSAERNLISREAVEANAESIRAQLARFLDFDGPFAARMANNAEWLATLPVLDFLRDVGKHFTVNVMLAKESVRTRMEAGISYTEFSYMLLQAYDFVELHRRHGVTMQLGGSDQWGNITAGTELLRRMAGAQGHGLTMPLLMTASGTKFGKTEAGAVWLDAQRTSPYQFFQFWIQSDDRDVGRLLRYFTLLPRERVEALDAATAERPERREAQHALAMEVTTRVHGADAARAAAEVSSLLFAKGDPRALSAEGFAALSREVPFCEISLSHQINIAETVTAILTDSEGRRRYVGAISAVDPLDLFVRTELVKSKGEARRLLEQGGLTVSGRRLSAGERTLGDGDVLGGGFLLLRKGARDYAVVRLS